MSRDRPEGNDRRLWEKPLIGVARPIQRVLPSIRNMAHGYAGHAVEAASFLLLTPFLVRELGLAIFGMWSVAVALAEWMQLLDLGMKEAVMKYVAAHQARSDARSVRQVCDTALFTYILAGLAALGVGMALAWLVVPRMVLSGVDLADARLVLLLLVASAAISLPAGLGGTLLEGLSRFDLLNLLRMGHAALRLALIVVALQLGGGLLGVALAEVATRVMLHAGRWWAVYRIDPVLIPRPWPHRAVRGELFNFSAWNAIRQAGELLVNKIYEPILSLLAGMPAVGAFYIARHLGSMPAELIVPMSGVLFPLSSELEAVGRGQTLRRTFLVATKVSLVVALPVGLVLAFGAGPILANWMGGRTPEAAPVLSILSFAFIIVAAALPSEVILLGLGRARLLAILGLAQGAVIILLGIPLVERFGPSGLALSALAAVILLQIFVQMPLAARACGESVGSLLRCSILPPLLASLPVAVGMILLRNKVAVGGLAALATWAGVSLAAYLLLLWVFGFERDEKQFLRSQIRRLVLAPSRIDD
ncbi:MAG: lipopolysaccharide biosynthesis protein, partial [Acidobacteria bacterium]|nr:lipopolysaccharide biosynthesis protein [Acidobacteriota bacterium]